MTRLYGDKIVNAYIDGANLHKAVESNGQHLDYYRLRVWLSEKYNISKVFLFIGYIPKNYELYFYLEKIGFILIYKEVVIDRAGKMKGNCDADLVLRTVQDYFEDSFSKAIIISSDGDFSCLVRFLKDRSAFQVLISPNRSCSYLLKKLNIPIDYLANHPNLFF